MTTLTDSNGIRFAAGDVILAKDLDDVAAFYRNYVTVSWASRNATAEATAADFNALLSAIQSGLGDNYTVTLPSSVSQSSEITAVEWGTPVKKYVPPPIPDPSHLSYIYTASNTYELTLDATIYAGRSTIRWVLAGGGGGGCGAFYNNGTLIYGAGGGAGSVATGSTEITAAMATGSTISFSISVDGWTNGGSTGGFYFYPHMSDNNDPTGGAGGWCKLGLYTGTYGASIDSAAYGVGGGVTGSTSAAGALSGSRGSDYSSQYNGELQVPSQFPYFGTGGAGGTDASVVNYSGYGGAGGGGSGICAGGGSAGGYNPGGSMQVRWLGGNGAQPMAYIEIIPN